MKRRDFLRSSGWFVVGASLVGVPGCAEDELPAPDNSPPAGTHVFPQGVASGDPSATTVVLWTRVALASTPNGGFGAITLRLQVSTTSDFAALIVDQPLVAAAQSDHTLRVLVTGLSPATYYYYRFVAGKDGRVGRTRTAPARDADVQVNLAWVSCQDYTAGHYGTYRQMIVDDAARPEADKIHAVVHLGDMIYETRDDGFQAALDANFEPIALTNRDGSPRALAAFPSGGGARVGVNFARSVDDYRHLYKTFLSDPDLQEARALWPFVCVWDDHEFTDDNWQSQGNYDRLGGSTNEGDQTRKVAASQAWFEYTPAHLSGAAGVPGVANPARDFVAATVRDAPFIAPNDANFVDETNNAAAVGAITIYRSLRFGKHVELVMTDQRSYRSDHAIPEEDTLNQLFPAPRNAVPLAIVNTFDAGRTFLPTPPASVLGIPNRRAESPPGTMLGAAQKAWWKATMKGSDATWKLWGSEVMLLRLHIPAAPGNVARVMSADAWDGYRTERNELMRYLQAENIKNLVVLAGDIHASFAGVLMDDYDAAAPQPVAYELTAAGVSSNSLFSFFEAATRDPAIAPLRPLVTVDASANGGSKFTENLNLLLLHGVASAGTFDATKNLQTALGQSAALTTNPHLKYCDTNAQGYGYVKIGATEVQATLVTINRPTAVPGANGPGHLRSASFRIPKDNPNGTPLPTVTGTKPFPLT